MKSCLVPITCITEETHLVFISKDQRTKLQEITRFVILSLEVLFQVLPIILSFKIMRNILYLFILVSIFTLGCEDPIEVDLRDDKKRIGY